MTYLAIGLATAGFCFGVAFERIWPPNTASFTWRPYFVLGMMELGICLGIMWRQ